MESVDFFKNDFVQNTEDLKDRLTNIVRKVSSMDRDLVDEDKKTLDKLIQILGEVPPIQLIKELMAYYNKKRFSYVSDDIPSLLHEYGLSKATTIDNIDVSLIKEVTIKVVDKVKLSSWLEKEGYGPYIKDTLDFQKGELTNEFLEFLNSKGVSYEKKSDIHHSSLKKIIKDRVNNDEPNPDNDVLNIKLFERAKIK